MRHELSLRQNVLALVHRWRSLLMGGLIISAGICLGIGLFKPVVQLTWLWIWDESHSIVSVISVLYEKNEIFLAGILFSFSVAFPIFKIIYLVFAYWWGIFIRKRQIRSMKLLSWLGKWSMLDVLVLALLVFYVKQKEFADASALPGIYYFTSAVILTMLASHLCEYELGRLAPPKAPKKPVDKNAGQSSYDSGMMAQTDSLRGAVQSLSSPSTGNSDGPRFAPGDGLPAHGV